MKNRYSLKLALLVLAASAVWTAAAPQAEEPSATLAGEVRAAKPFQAAEVYIRNIDKHVLYMVYSESGRYEATRPLSGNHEGQKGAIFDVRPWKQYFDPKGQPPPKSIVRNVTVNGIKGSFGSFGAIHANPGQTTISDFKLENIDVQLEHPELSVDNGINVTLQNVKINGEPFTLRPA